MIATMAPAGVRSGNAMCAPMTPSRNLICMSRVFIAEPSRGRKQHAWSGADYILAAFSPGSQILRRVEIEGELRTRADRKGPAAFASQQPMAREAVFAVAKFERLLRAQEQRVRSGSSFVGSNHHVP